MIRPNTMTPNGGQAIVNQVRDMHRMLDSSRAGIPSDMIVMQTTMGVVVTQDPLTKRKGMRAAAGQNSIPRWG